MKFKLFGITFYVSYTAVAFLSIALLSDKNGSLFLCVLASLIHEAAIGKIAGEQLIKLMTLGLSEKEAEEQIINGFLK